jgi:DNA-binding transcriptional LysR family regulator
MAVIDAAAQGHGVAPLPCFLGDGEPGLARLGDPIESLTMGLWVLTHPDLRHTARVRPLMTFLVGALREEKGKIEGASASS